MTAGQARKRKESFFFCVALLAVMLLLTSMPLAGGLAWAAEKNGATPSEDEYGNVTEEEVEGATQQAATIRDPLQPFNRAMFQFNDRLYFWALKPATKGYMRVVPESFRILFRNFYTNVKAPVRIVNNLLQLKPGAAGRELGRFVINSTVGVGGLRDCAKECFGINGRDADFGQTLGKYGVGFGFYLVWPVLGPSSPRDTVGYVADQYLTPWTYLGSSTLSPATVGIYLHQTINSTSFHLGEYEALKKAAIDPYVAVRDAYVQYRKKLIEESRSGHRQTRNADRESGKATGTE